MTGRGGTWAIAAAAAGAILGALAGWPWLHWVCKPLATALILAMACAAPAGAYRRAIALGLVCAIGGDVALMLPGDWFTVGLGCFLLTHLAYLAALTREVRLGARIAPFAVMGVLAAGLVAVLWTRLPPGLGAPVAGYAAVLGAMAAQALARAGVIGGASARLAALGGVLFVASDASLALNRFLWPSGLSPLWVLASYYAAQWCFARSAVRIGAQRADAPAPAPI